MSHTLDKSTWTRQTPAGFAGPARPISRRPVFVVAALSGASEVFEIGGST